MLPPSNCIMNAIKQVKPICDSLPCGLNADTPWPIAGGQAAASSPSLRSLYSSMQGRLVLRVLLLFRVSLGATGRDSEGGNGGEGGPRGEPSMPREQILHNLVTALRRTAARQNQFGSSGHKQVEHQSPCTFVVSWGPFQGPGPGGLRPGPKPPTGPCRARAGEFLPHGGWYFALCSTRTTCRAVWASLSHPWTPQKPDPRWLLTLFGGRYAIHRGRWMFCTQAPPTHRNPPIHPPLASHPVPRRLNACSVLQRQ